MNQLINERMNEWRDEITKPGSASKSSGQWSYRWPGDEWISNMTIIFPLEKNAYKYQRVIHVMDSELCIHSIHLMVKWITFLKHASAIIRSHIRITHYNTLCNWIPCKITKCFSVKFNRELGVVRVLTSHLGFTRPSSIYFSLGRVRDIVPPIISRVILLTFCSLSLSSFWFCQLV